MNFKQKSLKLAITATLVTASTSAFATYYSGSNYYSGTSGSNYYSGSTYYTGPKGDKGDTGPRGPRGYTGSKGATGSIGATGAKGETGATGAKGETGATGARGAVGPKGDTGATGSRGMKGETGAVGPRGPAGTGGDISRFVVTKTCDYTNISQFANTSTVANSECVSQCPGDTSLISGGCNLSEAGFVIAENGPLYGNMTLESWSCDALNLNAASMGKNKVTITSTAVCLSADGSALSSDGSTENESNDNDNNNQNNAAPVAVADSFTATAGNPLTIDVLANDTGSGISISTFNEWTSVNGRITQAGDKLVYTPYGDFTGTTEFWYSIIDSQGRTYSTKVSIHVK